MFMVTKLMSLPTSKAVMASIKILEPIVLMELTAYMLIALINH